MADPNLAKAAAQSVHPAYQDRIIFYLTHQKHQPLTRGFDSEKAIRAIDGSICFCLELDVRGLVTKATHQGAEGIRSALLECLAQVAEGRSIVELREHGALRVERMLRNPEVPAPVLGLVTPKNADPEFAWLERFVSQIEASKFQDTANNTWTDAPNVLWMNQTTAEQLDRINTTIPLLLLAIAWQGRPPRAVAVEHTSRIVLSYDSTRDTRNEGGALMALERALKDAIEPRIEIVLESLDDRNRREERSALKKQKLLATQNLFAGGSEE